MIKADNCRFLKSSEVTLPLLDVLCVTFMEFTGGDFCAIALAEFERKRIDKLAAAFIEKCRPPAHIRDQLDLGYRISGQSLELCEIRPVWDNPSEKLEEPVAKATFVKKTSTWKVYWQRQDLKWHRYDPDPEVDTLGDFLAVVDADEYAFLFEAGYSIQLSYGRVEGVLYRRFTHRLWPENPTCTRRT